MRRDTFFSLVWAMEDGLSHSRRHVNGISVTTVASNLLLKFHFVPFFFFLNLQIFLIEIKIVVQLDPRSWECWETQQGKAKLSLRSQEELMAGVAVEETSSQSFPAAEALSSTGCLLPSKNCFQKGRRGLILFIFFFMLWWIDLHASLNWTECRQSFIYLILSLHPSGTNVQIVWYSQLTVVSFCFHFAFEESFDHVQ